MRAVGVRRLSLHPDGCDAGSTAHHSEGRARRLTQSVNTTHRVRSSSTDGGSIVDTFL